MKLAMPKVYDSAAFWRGLCLILLSFVAGNATAFFSFGLGRASTKDLQAVVVQQAATNKELSGIHSDIHGLVEYLKGKNVVQRDFDGGP